MEHDPFFGRANRHLYPQGPDHIINNPIEQGHNRGPSDNPGIAGTPSETTVATPRQIPPLHPDYIPNVRERIPAELLQPYRKPKSGMVIPRYGVLYDSQRTRDGWDHLVDLELEGTVTTINGTVNTTISLGNFQAVFNRAMMYPGAVSFYMCIRAFNAAPTTSTGTGTVTFKFLDKNNNPIPLGVATLNGVVTQSNLSSIVPTPYTDPTDTLLGTLVTTTTTGANFPVYVYQIAFSYVYLLPVMDSGAYEPLRSDGTEQSKREIERHA